MWTPNSGHSYLNPCFNCAKPVPNNGNYVPIDLYPVPNNPNPVPNNPNPLPNNPNPLSNNLNPVPSSFEGFPKEERGTDWNNGMVSSPHNYGTLGRMDGGVNGMWASTSAYSYLNPFPNYPNPVLNNGNYVPIDLYSVPNNPNPLPNNPNPLPNNPDPLSNNLNPVPSPFEGFPKEVRGTNWNNGMVSNVHDYGTLERMNMGANGMSESTSGPGYPSLAPKNPSPVLNNPYYVPNNLHPVPNYLNPVPSSVEGFQNKPEVWDHSWSGPNDRQPTTHPTQSEMPQSTTRPVCMEMYYRLRSIFPNIDPDYIKNICPSEWGLGDRDAQIISLVEYLLQQADHLPATTVKTKFENDAVDTCDNVDGIYEMLLGIFPDADPNYLRKTAKKVVDKPDALNEFVEEKLQSHNYPTIKQYMTGLKITEQRRQYTTGFDIKQFLTIIPDPFKYFMDPKRKCSHNITAFNFLKSYFNKIRVKTIKSIYAKSQYNVSITAAKLADMECNVMATSRDYKVRSKDVILLQEIAFIKHKKELSDHMLKEKTLEETEFRMLKAKNGLIECQCCFDSECIPSKCSDCENGHRFCNSCVEKGTSAKMADGETRITCFVNCGSEFSLSTLQRVLAPTTFSILLKKRQAADIIEAGVEGLVFCPFCDFASIPPEEDKVFKCLNPECTKESCRLCKKLNHVPLKCDEGMEFDKERHYIEEKMTQALARTCYKCRRAFIKEEGCNRITCSCGASMCYLCDQPLHGNTYKHFRGQGSDKMNLCPLYSDTIRLDAVAVRKAAEQAQMEIMKINPNIKIDTTKLLPIIPGPTTGPHTAVINADELPLRVRQVRYDPL